MPPTSQAETAILVRRCRQGDDRAWAKLVDQFKNLVYSVAYRMGMNAEDSADVFQSTFVSLYRSLDKVEEPAVLARWLSVTAARECFRISRNKGRLVNLSDETLGLEEVLIDEEARADRIAIEASEAELLRLGVGALPEKCRLLLSKLYLADEPSYDQIAVELHMAVGSIGPTRARCLEKLRRVLASQGFFADDMYQIEVSPAP